MLSLLGTLLATCNPLSRGCQCKCEYMHTSVQGTCMTSCRGVSKASGSAISAGHSPDQQHNLRCLLQAGSERALQLETQLSEPLPAKSSATPACLHTNHMIINQMLLTQMAAQSYGRALSACFKVMTCSPYRGRACRHDASWWKQLLRCKLLKQVKCMLQAEDA